MYLKAMSFNYIDMYCLTLMIAGSYGFLAFGVLFILYEYINPLFRSECNRYIVPLNFI